MSDKRYPTRMHEVLTKPGEPPLQTGERFRVKDLNDEFFVNIHGRMMLVAPSGHLRASGEIVAHAINHGITRRPRLTEEQVRHLKGLYLLGFRWIERDEHDALVAWENYDDKADVFQNDFLPLSYRSYQVLIVVPTRNAPLNIVQTLRDAGVEVDDG